LQRLFCHRLLVVRFLSLLALGLATFWLSWTIGYYLLPEGILRGRTVAAALAGSSAAGSFASEFARIAGINLAFAAVFVVGANRLLSVRGYPLGYLPPILWSLLYGVFLGTNSFSIPLPAPMAPSLEVFRRSGLYEIAAYVLIAASTHGISVARSPSFFSFTSEPVCPKPRLGESVSWRGVIVAVLLLLTANAWEAYQILWAVE